MMSSLPIVLSDVNQRVRKNAKVDPKNKYYWAFGEEAGGWILDFGVHSRKPLNEVPFYNYLNFCREASKRYEFHQALEKYREGLINKVDKHFCDFVVPFGKKHFGQRLGECRDPSWSIWLLSRDEEFKKHYDVFFMALEAFVDEASRTGNWGEHKYPDSDDEEESESIDGEYKVMLAIPDNLESDKFDRNGFPIRQVSPPQTPKKSFEKVKLFKDEADHRPSLGLLTPEQTPVCSRQTSSHSAEVSVKDIKKESSDLFGPSLTVVNSVRQGTQAHPTSTSPRLKKRKAEDSDSEDSGFMCVPQCPPTPAASPVKKRKVVVKVESDD